MGLGTVAWGAFINSVTHVLLSALPLDLARVQKSPEKGPLRVPAGSVSQLHNPRTACFAGNCRDRVPEKSLVPPGHVPPHHAIPFPFTAELGAPLVDWGRRSGGEGEAKEGQEELSEEAAKSQRKKIA